MSLEHLKQRLGQELAALEQEGRYAHPAVLSGQQGPTEGFLHRLKLLKRQAYGWAGVALLKQRMLFHPSALIAA